MVSSCMLVDGLESPLLDVHTLLHFGEAKGLAEDDWDAARSVCPCVFPLRLHASLLRTYDRLFSLMSANCLGLRPPAAMTDG